MNSLSDRFVRRGEMLPWVLVIGFALSLGAQVVPKAGSGFTTLAAKANEARDSNRLSEAIVLYKRALALRPAWAEGWWNLGTLLYDQDNYTEAATALRKAATLNPKAGRAYAMLGLCEAKLGRNRAALQHIELGWKLGVGDNRDLARVLLYTRGNLLLAAGEFGEAQEALGLLARNDVDQEDLILSLGLSVLGLRPPVLAAADSATRAIIRRAGWAEHLAARREVQAASQEYSSLAADAPKFHNVQFAYGRFLLANHQDEKAVEAFRRQIENTPNHLLARLGIAGIKHITDPAAGLPYAEQAVRLAPALPEAHYLLGLLLNDTGDTARAIRELETAQRAEPGEAKVYFALSQAYSAAGRPEDAERALATFGRLKKQSNPEDLEKQPKQ